MNPIHEHALHRNPPLLLRPHAAAGIGAAGAGVAAEPAAVRRRSRGDAARAARRAAGSCTTRRRPSGSSSCSWPMAPSQLDLFDYKPKLDGVLRQGPARLGPQGPADHDDDHAARRASRSRRRCSSSRSTASAARGSASCCRTSATIVDDICHRQDRCTPRRSITTRPSPSSRPAARFPAGRAWARGSATASAARTRTCRRSSCCTRGWPPASQPQALFSRLWGAGFLPTQAPGRGAALERRPGAVSVEPAGRRSPTRAARMLDGLAELNQQAARRAWAIPEIAARIAQYEMAFRMQTSRAGADRHLARSRKHVLDLYGPEVKQPGTFADNCLLARRLAERGVRFTQVFHRGWDQHGNLPEQHPPASARTIDQPAAALDQGPQAARPARRHARRLGRRVRPHRLQPGRR